MVGLPQNMVGKQRKNQGAELTCLDPLYAGMFEVTEFLGQCKRGPSSHRCSAAPFAKDVLPPESKRYALVMGFV